jgi:hypothetical protein
MNTKANAVTAYCRGSAAGVGKPGHSDEAINAALSTGAETAT